MPHNETISHEMRNYIQKCLNCYSVCLETIQYYLRMGGEHAGSDHIRPLTLCGEICQTSANFMLSGSEFHFNGADHRRKFRAS